MIIPTNTRSCPNPPEYESPPSIACLGGEKRDERARECLRMEKRAATFGLRPDGPAPGADKVQARALDPQVEESFFRAWAAHGYTGTGSGEGEGSAGTRMGGTAYTVMGARRAEPGSREKYSPQDAQLKYSVSPLEAQGSLPKSCIPTEQLGHLIMATSFSIMLPCAE